MKVFAFDPGQTTGFCTIDVQPDGKDFRVVRCGEIEWEVRLENTYDVMCDMCSEDFVVIEAFRLFPHKAMAQIGSQFPSVQMIGIIEAMYYLASFSKPITYQQPGDIARVATLDRDLKWVAGSAHKIDAYRHARLYFLQHFYITPFQ